jgi:nitrite reductase/ring-hydroxylating ferredoxin subunit
MQKPLSTKDLPPGSMTQVVVNGKSILLANINGRFYAIGNVCTHMGCSLTDGTLTGYLIECPCHGSTFNVTTGTLVKGPAAKPEPVFQVAVSGDKISIAGK